MAKEIYIISGYKFIFLHDLDVLHQRFLEKCTARSLKGTILLSAEGININVCGSHQHITLFKNDLKSDNRFADISFRESSAEQETFLRLKVKIKNEIITFRKSTIDPITQRAANITPETLKQWLDEKRDFIFLDVRNRNEIEHGTFTDAIHLNLENFSEFPDAVHHIEKGKTVVMFCTGGIRCEKAALYMQNVGYQNVFQLQGGILNYFTQIGRTHYQGDCFVFDDRIRV